MEKWSPVGLCFCSNHFANSRMERTPSRPSKILRKEIQDNILLLLAFLSKKSLKDFRD